MRAICKTLGILLSCFSFTMLSPLIVALLYHEQQLTPYLVTFILTLLVGVLLWLPQLRYQQDLRTGDGFIIVTLFWLTLSLFAALPLFLQLHHTLSFTNAFFESMSGLSTTGATIFNHVDSLPHSLLFYRQQLHLLGGIGIVVLAVAVLPMLGVGGMQLYQAEITGPMKQSKLTPRIAQTAKALWLIYTGLIILCGLSYYVAGMSPFAAICESFSTISTGGFSIHDTSLGFYHSRSIELIATAFMALGAISFSLHFQLLRHAQWQSYWRDPECRSYLRIILISAILIACILMIHHHYTMLDNGIHALFTVVSITSTTGLVTTDFSIWPSICPYVLVFLSLLGGCAGSTAGGIKVMRGMILKQQAVSELHSLIHPKSIRVIKFGQSPLPDKVIRSMWGFLILFIMLFAILLLALLATGLPFLTAFSALVACISNTGAGIAGVASNYHALTAGSKWILILSMLAGRLEIFTLMVLFIPSYWRR